MLHGNLHGCRNARVPIILGLPRCRRFARWRDTFCSAERQVFKTIVDQCVFMYPTSFGISGRTSSKVSSELVLACGDQPLRCRSKGRYSRMDHPRFFSTSSMNSSRLPIDDGFPHDARIANLLVIKLYARPSIRYAPFAELICIVGLPYSFLNKAHLVSAFQQQRFALQCSLMK